MLDPDGDAHLYLQIAEILRDRVESLPPGTRVPSEAAIEREFGVARTTARRALRVLRGEGLVYTVHGEGTFTGSPGEAQRRPRGGPVYREIAAELIHGIRNGSPPPRRRLPSKNTLVQRHDVARETVRRALALLREEGWIYTVPHRGSFVSPQDKWPAIPAGVEEQADKDE